MDSTRYTAVARMKASNARKVLLEQVGGIAQFGRGDLPAHGRSQHHDDDLTDHGGPHLLQRGRQHHAPEGLARRQRQTVRGFDLAAWRGLDARADDLGRVRAQVDHHGQHGGELRRELEPQRGQPEEQEKQLHDEGRVAHQLHIAGHRPAQWQCTRPEVAGACPGTGRAQQQAQHGAHDGQDNRTEHA